MTTTVRAYAATGPDQPLAPTTIERRDVGPHDVRIDIRFAGICHSDIHTVRGDWGPVPYPLVVGHEIAGVVAEVGPAVTRFSVGDRVGVGCMVDSCRECDQCAKGQEQYCRRGATMTYASTGRDGAVTHGGYAQQIVVTEDFVLRIPDALPLDEAAPLLCAGVTTYSPLRHWRVGPGTRVAVVGMGGLGHLAVRLAHALGAHVTVLSQTLGKREDGLRLGADEYHATADPATFERLAGSVDLVLSTVSAVLDVDAYLGLLTVDGTMVNVGAPPQALPVRPFSLIGGRKSLAGSSIGSVAETQEMLDFCAEHGIGAEIEVVAADEVNRAWERVLASDVRYRFVIDVATLS
ncbi:NAD(P)-dependent alcohol dehydrogenase [Cellulomonas hominis]|uniref:NAD(P)-dependent alcohol dehydrogenase n=1 Tax=Cellulomonas hominis TaxID=156981 RepID=UPI0014447F56|nr:NAD(P)-dependent alcohol dehydrogenase [Cellulomonas hominis]NKY10418.1 NAD(P)-dependent alcohol dehydrogenase [Cellulomonas hominis]